MLEQGILTKQQMVAELLRSPHGALRDYVPLGQQAASQEPLFLSHVLAWNARKGSIRDARLALPTIALATRAFPDEFVENALAHLALLTPRELAGYRVRTRKEHTGVWPFLRSLAPSNRRLNLLKYELLRGYLRARESCWPWWERTALAFRRDLASLYKIAHLKPAPVAKAILFERHYPSGSIWESLGQLATWEADTVAGFLRAQRLPFLVVQGALGTRIVEPTILAAVLDIMTPGQLVTFRAALERWGAGQTAATRGATTAAVERARKGRTNVLKTTVAAQALAEEEPGLAVEFEALQEAQLDAAPGIDGNWLIAGDKSGSMAEAVGVAALLAAYMARKVTGQVCLCFFDTEPIYYDVTGKSYEDIQRLVQGMRGIGGTHIGSSLLGARERGFVADGIAIVSDGGDNAGYDFRRDYAGYTLWAGQEPPVYLYRVQGSDSDRLSQVCQGTAMPYQCFDIPQGIDHYALAGLAQTMRVSRYSLVQEIMDTPLLTLQQALRVPKQWRSYAENPQV
jgi:hypothetical protein